MISFKLIWWCENETLKNSKQENVLGVIIDSELTSATHLVNSIKSLQEQKIHSFFFC